MATIYKRRWYFRYTADMFWQELSIHLLSVVFTTQKIFNYAQIPLRHLTKIAHTQREHKSNKNNFHIILQNTNIIA